jgi:hypothetical protein
MKNNQPDPELDKDGIEPARLASFGVLVGLMVIGCFVLVLTLSSGAGTPTAAEVRPESRTAVEVPVDPATAAQQRASAAPTTDTYKTSANKAEASKRRGNSSSSSKASKPNKPYIISVAPGRTPRMTQVQ